MVRSLKQLAQRPYCAKIFMGLFNKLKEIPPVGSKRLKTFPVGGVFLNFYRERQMKTEQSTANWFLTTLVSVGCYSTEITLQRKNEKVSAQKPSCHITTVAENKGIN